MLGDAKYIVFDTPDAGEIIIVFPSLLVHVEVATQFRSWKPISAGFVSGLIACYGESMSLGLKCRDEKDNRLLLHSLNRMDGDFR